jgi:DNA-binding MarR family transcriptional regulator
MTASFTEKDMLDRLKRIDKSGIKARDILILHTIISSPGISGIDIAHKLGIPERSHIQSALYRMETLELIEDRRSPEHRRKANPAMFHALPKGRDLWDQIKPCDLSFDL